ncbi:MAG: hypothetical protein NTV29_11095 [Planctomycetota bacterium]|nr:hypothetical protein [Planctomycetota bacterium]
MRLPWPIWLFLKTSFCASHKLLDHPIGFAALKILRHLDAHDTEHRLPEVAEADFFLEQVALMVDPEAALQAFGLFAHSLGGDVDEPVYLLRFDSRDRHLACRLFLRKSVRLEA